MNKQNRKTHRYREHFDGFHMGGRVVRWVKNVKELRRTNWQLQYSNRDGKYSIRNIVNNIGICNYVWSQMGFRCVKEYEYAERH